IPRATPAPAAEAPPKAAPAKPAPTKPVVSDEPAAPRTRSSRSTAEAPAAPVSYPSLDPPVYTWLIDVADALVDFVQEYNKPEVSVEELNDFAGADFAETYPAEKSIPGRVHQICEFLADRGIVERTDRDGSYRAHPVLIDREQSVAGKLDRMDMRRALKREYTIECAVPYTGLKGFAVMLYDGKSFVGPELTFATAEGGNYIEVHHIQRIAQGGNESLENLALLNPYHHKMCHFASDDLMNKLQAELTGLVKARLEGMLTEWAGGGSGKTSKKPAMAAPVKGKKVEEAPVEKAAAKKAAPAAKAAPLAKKAAPKPAAKKAAAKPAAKKAAAKR
ncbi:MAG: HNH endonuclease signature motif containing protein, partial [bacterium]